MRTITVRGDAATTAPSAKPTATHATSRGHLPADFALAESIKHTLEPIHYSGK